MIATSFFAKFLFEAESFLNRTSSLVGGNLVFVVVAGEEGVGGGGVGGAGGALEVDVLDSSGAGGCTESGDDLGPDGMLPCTG